MVALLALGPAFVCPSQAVLPSLTAGSASPEIVVEATSNELGASVVRLRGIWPTPCLPLIERVTLNGHDLRVDIRSNQSLCSGPSMPFDLAFDPLSQLGHGLDPGVYRVTLLAANGPLAPLQARGFALVEIGKLSPVRPESGFWWPETGGVAGTDARGTGLSIEVQGESIAAALLTYSAEGAASWSFGTGTLRERSVEIDLIGMRDGSALLDSVDRTPRPVDVLTLQLEFLGNARATAWIGRQIPGPNQSLQQLRSLSLVRLPLSASTEAGSWRGDWLLLRNGLNRSVDSTRRITFSQTVQMDDEHFRLTSGDGFVLQCRRHFRALQSPPEQCSLNDASGALVARFDSVGLNRLDGSNDEGQRVELLRADPH
ncbi:MAG: hypothetical protein ABI411_15250 [Tahibacter sp.]